MLNEFQKSVDELFSPLAGDAPIAEEEYEEYGEAERVRGGFAHYDRLKSELNIQKQGGVDFHFSQIKDIDNLSNNVLDLYGRYEKGILSEDDIKKFRDNNRKLSEDEIHFIAMLLNWIINKKMEEKLKEVA